MNAETDGKKRGGRVCGRGDLARSLSRFQRKSPKTTVRGLEPKLLVVTTSVVVEVVRWTPRTRYEVLL